MLLETSITTNSSNKYNERSRNRIHENNDCEPSSVQDRKLTNILTVVWPHL